MKALKLFTLASLSLATVPTAHSDEHRSDRDRSDRRDRQRERERQRERDAENEFIDAILTDCSPQLVTKNVHLLEDALIEVSKEDSFKDAKFLRSALADIQTQKSINARIVAYCKIVGVDATDSQALAEFVGARDLAPYAAAARKNMKLSQAQSEQLVKVLTETLLSNINN